jgi:hypothetical protein
MPIRALPDGVLLRVSTTLVVIDRNRWSSSTEIGGRHRSDRVVVIDRNGWSRSIGTPGRHRLDRVAAIDRNDRSSSIGTGGRHHPVCAPRGRLYRAFGRSMLVPFNIRGAGAPGPASVLLPTTHR